MTLMPSFHLAGFSLTVLQMYCPRYLLASQVLGGACCQVRSRPGGTFSGIESHHCGLEAPSELIRASISALVLVLPFPAAAGAGADPFAGAAAAGCAGAFEAAGAAGACVVFGVMMRFT